MARKRLKLDIIFIFVYLLINPSLRSLSSVSSQPIRRPHLLSAFCCYFMRLDLIISLFTRPAEPNDERCVSRCGAPCAGSERRNSFNVSVRMMSECETDRESMRQHSTERSSKPRRTMASVNKARTHDIEYKSSFAMRHIVTAQQCPNALDFLFTGINCSCFGGADCAAARAAASARAVSRSRIWNFNGMQRNNHLKPIIDFHYFYLVFSRYRPIG